MTTLTHPKPYGVGKWPPLPALVGSIKITAEQARDIVAWHQPQH